MGMTPPEWLSDSLQFFRLDEKGNDPMDVARYRALL